MKIIQHRRRVEVVKYYRAFDWREHEGSGFSFPCDKHGNVEPMQPAGQENWDKCISGEHDVVDMGIRRVSWSYIEPKIGECEECGKPVELEHFTNTCECGADYNMSGSLLAPRCQWGCDTGESVDDILAVDCMTPEECFDGDY